MAVMRELIIIGCGPAGITAGIYAARKGIDFSIITKDIGGQTIYSSAVENYTGYQVLTGIELAEKFREHLQGFNIALLEGREAVEVKKEQDIVVVKTSDGEIFNAKCCIIASGRNPRKLNVKGEDSFYGRGVTYCATCDGPLYRGKNVAVIGGGNSALDAVIQLLKIASKVYLIDIAEELKADKIMIEKVKNNNRLEILDSTRVEEIMGLDSVEKIAVNTKHGRKELDVQGIFIEIGTKANSQFIDNVTKNKDGEIIVDCDCKTSIDGIFAAGDVTDVSAKQIIVACGEGAKSALSAVEYLNRKIQ